MIYHFIFVILKIEILIYLFKILFIILNYNNFNFIKYVHVIYNVNPYSYIIIF